MAHNSANSWDGDDFRAYREEQQRKARERREYNTAVIVDFYDVFNEAYSVERKNEGSQYRVYYEDFAVDLWPTNRRFHNLTTNKRGDYKATTANGLASFLKAQFDLARMHPRAGKRKWKAPA